MQTRASSTNPSSTAWDAQADAEPISSSDSEAVGPRLISSSKGSPIVPFHLNAPSNTRFDSPSMLQNNEQFPPRVQNPFLHSIPTPTIMVPIRRTSVIGTTLPVSPRTLATVPFSPGPWRTLVSLPPLSLTLPKFRGHQEVLEAETSFSGSGVDSEKNAVLKVEMAKKD